MASFVPVNEIASNHNIFYDLDEIDSDLNFLAKDQESKPGKKSLITSFLGLFRRSEKHQRKDKEIRQGVIRLKLGDSYHTQSKWEQARENYKMAQKLLENNHSLQNEADDKLKELGNKSS
jgi:hypothetical protein